MYQQLLLIFLLHQSLSVFGYRILGIFPSASLSHHIFFRPVMQELSDRGHTVTVITPFPTVEQDRENYEQIDISEVKKFWCETYNANTSTLNSVSYTFKSIDTILKTTNVLLSTDAVKELIEDSSDYDLVIVEYLWMYATYAFAHKYKTPLVGIASFDEIDHRSLGNDWHPIHFAHNSVAVYGEANTFNRVYAFAARILEDVVIQPYLHFHNNKMIDAFFGTEFPRSQVLAKSLDLVIIDAPPALGFTRPILPNTVQLGFVHIGKPKPLPKELQRYFDTSAHGVIYFSLGSNIKSSHLSFEYFQIFIQVFRSLKYKIIWKWEENDLSKNFTNIRTVNWVPQQDLLRHHKIKLFIMQGGQQSLEEAVYNGVPVLVIPFYGDQRANAYRVEKIGIGKSIPLENLSEELLLKNIRELTENSSYRENSKRIGDIMRDTPMSPIDTAVWWIEYVIRHKGTRHFNYPYRGVSFWEHYLLDVWLVLMAMFSLIVFVVVKVWRCISSRRKISEKVKTN